LVRPGTAPHQQEDLLRQIGGLCVVAEYGQGERKDRAGMARIKQVQRLGVALGHTGQQAHVGGGRVIHNTRAPLQTNRARRAVRGRACMTVHPTIKSLWEATLYATCWPLRDALSSQQGRPLPMCRRVVALRILTSTLSTATILHPTPPSCYAFF